MSENIDSSLVTKHDENVQSEESMEEDLEQDRPYCKVKMMNGQTIELLRSEIAYTDSIVKLRKLVG